VIRLRFLISFTIPVAGRKKHSQEPSGEGFRCTSLWDAVCAKISEFGYPRPAPKTRSSAVERL